VISVDCHDLIFSIFPFYITIFKANGLILKGWARYFSEGRSLPPLAGYGPESRHLLLELLFFFDSNNIVFSVAKLSTVDWE